MDCVASVARICLVFLPLAALSPPFVVLSVCRGNLSYEMVRNKRLASACLVEDTKQDKNRSSHTAYCARAARAIPLPANQDTYEADPGKHVNITPKHSSLS